MFYLKEFIKKSQRRKVKKFAKILRQVTLTIPLFSNRPKNFFGLFAIELANKGYKEAESLKRVQEQDRHLIFRAKASILAFAYQIKKFLTPAVILSKALRRLIIGAIRWSIFKFKTAIQKSSEWTAVTLMAFVNFVLRNLTYPLIKIEQDLLTRRSVEVVLTGYFDLETAKNLAQIALQGGLTGTRSDKNFMKLLVELIPYIELKNKNYQERPKPTHKNLLLINAVIWGSSYRKLFYQFCLSSLATDGNFGANKNWKPVFQIFVPVSEKNKFHETRSFIESRLNGTLIIETFPDQFVPLASGDNRYWLFGGLSQSSIQLAHMWKCPIHLLNPDTVYSNDFFSNLKKINGKGFWGIFSNSFRTDKSRMTKILSSRRRDGILNIDAQELSKLAVTHCLKMYDDCTLSEATHLGKNYPSAPVFVSKKDDGTRLHTLHYQPLLIDMRKTTKRPKMNLFTIDSSFDSLMDSGSLDPTKAYFLNGMEGIHYLELSPSNSFRVDKISRDEFVNRFARQCRFLNQIQLDRSITFPAIETLEPAKNNKADFKKSFINELMEDLAEAEISAIASDHMMQFNFGSMKTLSEINKVLWDLETRLKTTRHFHYYKHVLDKLTTDIQEFTRNSDSQTIFASHDIINFADHCFRFDWLDTFVEFYDDLIARGHPNVKSNGEITAFSDCAKFILSAKNDPNTFSNSLDTRAKRADNTPRRKQTFSYTLWGEQFCDLFIKFQLSCLLSEGNIPFLCKNYDVEILILADRKSVQTLRRNDVIQRLSHFARISFKILPAEIVRKITQEKHWFYTLYGALDHVGIEEARKNNSALFLLPVDSLLSSNLCRFISTYSGKALVFGGGNVVFNEESISNFDKKFRQPNGNVIASGRELLHTALENAHQYFWSQLIQTQNSTFGAHARETFILSNRELQINSVFIHPLHVTDKGLQQYERKNYTNVDYGMIPRITDDVDSIFVPDTIDDFYISNSCSRTRLYETTSHPFIAEEYFQYHQNAYSIQRKIFSKPQRIKLDSEQLLASFEATEEEFQELENCVKLMSA